VCTEQNVDPKDFEIIHTDEVIGMSEKAAKAFQQKQNSSIGVGLKMLAEKKLDGFASAGNTGAVFVGSLFTVKAIPGILRPAISTVVPKESGSTGTILDIGVNADCKPEVLAQFAILGSMLLQHVFGVKDPKVGLMNIGEEREKGNQLCQATYPLLEQSKRINFAGNIEGRDLFNNKADVIVCDGFTGNIILKLAESFYWVLRKREITDEYFEKFNFENYGGTPILGINSTVVIGHGISKAKAIKNMITLTYRLADARLSEKISSAFQESIVNQ
ncbi:MAG: phosphate acyltransferase, partial [Bacteroidia bacterium]|nr:phosphate acyltransferase [Bacteroidia bacterium]